MGDLDNTDWEELSPAERPYSEVILPEDKDKVDWSVNERRAFILDKIVNEYGLPDDVPRVKMGEKFGVSHAQIYKDVNILKEYMSSHLDTDFEAEAFALFKSAVRDLKDEDPYKAVQVMEKWSGWLEDRGEVENESEETVSFTGEDDMSITFNTVSDDGGEE